MENIIDQRVGHFSANSWARGIIDEIKAKYAAKIREVVNNQKSEDAT